MKRHLSALLAALLIQSAAAVAGPVQSLDRIVAIVNDEVITRYEFDQQRRIILDQLKRQNVPPPAEDVFDKQVLERMIADKAQLQFAKETGIRVDDAMLDRAIARIAEDLKLSPAQFREALEKEGMSMARYREEIRNEITITRLREREVESRLSVTDAEVSAYMASNPEAAGKQDEYRLAHVLVLVPDQATPEQIQAKRRRAEEALRQIQGGADFGQVAAGFSDAPDALSGGNLGWRPAAKVPVVFADAVKALQPGGVSQVLKSATGFHIVKLLEKRGKDAPTVVDQTRARHILIKVNEIVSETDAKTKIDRVKERLEKGGDFAELAKQNSEDVTASRGGELGWISTGDTVPEFEGAMDKLKVNQVSEPVRSPYGWHLIQVLERRKEDVTAERAKALARNAIRQRKSEEGYQDWVRQIRDRAFVEMRLDDR